MFDVVTMAVKRFECIVLVSNEGIIPIDISLLLVEGVPPCNDLARLVPNGNYERRHDAATDYAVQKTTNLNQL